MANRTLLALSVLSVSVLIAPAAAFGQTLKHEKYQLANGLTVILHEDHTLPVATINLWYRVGARNEPAGRSGFAHLFEHLMFMGTKRVPGSDFDNLMEAGGGANNASTSLDRTNYFSLGPSSLLPTLLWLDADRLEELGPTMTVEKLNLQRDVVRNEIRQNVENTPYGRAYEFSTKALYPPAHPYYNNVYGSHQDLEAATVLDVKDFFATFYTPDNCSLVVAGDFDPAQIKPMVAGLFGSIPRGNVAPQKSVPPVKLDRVVRTTMLDSVQLPKIAISFHSPATYAAGDAEATILSLILADGKSSRLYKRLIVADGTAASVSAVQENSALGSILRIEVLTKPEADVWSVERAVDDEVAKLVKEGPTEAEVSQRAATIETGLVSSLQSLRARADKLNEYEYYLGNPDSLDKDLARFRSATPASVKTWAGTILTPDAKLVQWVLPDEAKGAESTRDKRPGDAAAKPFAVPTPETFKLANGISVHLWSKPGLPLTAAALVIKPPATAGAGQVAPNVVKNEGLIDTPEMAGLGSLTAAMLQEGAGERDSASFSEAVAAIGASLTANAGQESITVSVQSLGRNFQAAMGLMADAAIRPRLAATDFDRAKGLHLDELEQIADQPGLVAGRVATRLLLGERNAYGWPASGTAASVKRLTLDDLKGLHGALFRPEFATIVVAGDLSAAEAKSILERSFGTWSVKSSVASSPDEVSYVRSTGMRVFVVDRPDAVQTVLHMAMPGIGFGDLRRVPLELVNVILGGSFTSRLNRNLREVHGYTYGARSRVVSRPALGMVTASSSVKADVTGAALKEFMAELTRIGSGDISAEELGKARETYLNDMAESFGTLGGVLGVADELIAQQAPFTSTERDLATARKVDVAAVNGAAKEIFKLSSGVLVLVGDQKLIMAQLKGMDLPEPVVVDNEGKPVVAK